MVGLVHSGQEGTRTPYLRSATAALSLVSYKPVEPAARLELTTDCLQGSCTANRAALAMCRTPGRIRTGNLRSLRPTPLPLGYEGMILQRVGESNPCFQDEGLAA